MKKILSLLLIFVFLLTYIPASVSANIPVSSAIPVPYDITYELLTTDSFTVNSLRDFERLLDFTEKLHLEILYVFPPEDIYDECVEMAEKFIQDNSSNMTRTYSVGQSSAYFMMTLHWKVFKKYDNLSVISNIDDLYAAAKQCTSHHRWRKVYKLDKNFALSIDYSANKLDKAFAAIKSKYGEDISDFVPYHSYTTHSYFHQPNGAYLVATECTTRRKEENLLFKDRYNRIQKYNLVVPITDDMPEDEKIRILAKSVGNVFHEYEVTAIVNQLYQYAVGVGQCAHHATVFKNLCDLYGIECQVIGGYAFEYGDHSWNLVKYNGNWYHLDTTGTGVECRDVNSENIPLTLSNDQTMINRKYEWDKNKYPACTNETIIFDTKELSFPTEETDTIKKYQMFTPYKAYDPMTPGPMIHYDIYFDKSKGKIVAIDTNLDQDLWEKVSGNAVRKKPVLEIPSEIDGVKVKSIGSYINYHKPLGKFTHIIIPDNITLDEHAFHGLTMYSTSTLTIGDGVDIGIGALPFGTPTIELGENVLYRGPYSYAKYKHTDPPKLYDYTNTFSGVIIYFSENKTVSVPEGYDFVYYGCGNNILDQNPVNSLKINKDVKYIDPRLNRHNRIFEVDSENPYYTSENGILYNKNKTELISVPIGVKEIDIPETVTKIGDYAFCYNNEIEYIYIPDSVKTTEKHSFEHLSNIKKIIFEGNIPKGFTLRLSADAEIIQKTKEHQNLIYCNTDETYINITTPEGNAPVIAFFDIYDNLLDVKKASNVKIPIYAVTYKIFSWQDNMNPISFAHSDSFIK